MLVAYLKGDVMRIRSLGNLCCVLLVCINCLGCLTPGWTSTLSKGTIDGLVENSIPITARTWTSSSRGPAIDFYLLNASSNMANSEVYIEIESKSKVPFKVYAKTVKERGWYTLSEGDRVHVRDSLRFAGCAFNISLPAHGSYPMVLHVKFKTPIDERVPYKVVSMWSDGP